MPITKLRNLSILCLLMLAACAMKPATYKPQSTAPIVTCGERSAGEDIPAYPLANAVEQAYIAANVAQGLDAYLILAQAQKDLITAQNRWAIQASGIVRRGNIKRISVADCLDAYRARGLIR